VSGNDLVIVIDQNGVVKAKAFDTARNLLDLLRRVGAGIAGIGSQRVGRSVFKVHVGSKKVWLWSPRKRRRSLKGSLLKSAE
jgi:hypothetical protein